MKKGFNFSFLKHHWLRILFLTIVLLGGYGKMDAQKIGYVETTKAWYYVYDQNGRKIRTISTSSGEMVAYSSEFYILKQGTAFYATYLPDGRKLYTFSVSSVGEVLAASGDTFTSRNGAWIFTWSKEGKKINTRSAR